MTSPTRRTAPATALQMFKVRTHFPAPTYGREAVQLDTLHVCVLRFLNATGDLLVALILIGGGMSLIGFATHL